MTPFQLQLKNNKYVNIKTASHLSPIKLQSWKKLPFWSIPFKNTHEQSLSE